MKKSCPTCLACVHAYDDCKQEPNGIKYCDYYDICLDCEYHCSDFEPDPALFEDDDLPF